MAEPTCPYCNASLARVEAAADGRSLCPRCGEALPGTVTRQLSGSAPAAQAAPAAATGPGRKRTAAVILGIMMFMAAVGLSYALWTTSFRRENDYRTKKGMSVKATPTSDLDMLGLLPAQCNVVAAINFADLLRHTATRGLFDEPQPPVVEWMCAGLDRWTGLKPSDVEQIALGTELAASVPHLTVLVRTKRPYAPQKMVERFAPAQPTQHRRKPLVRFPLQSPFGPPGKGLGGEGLLWCHSERVLALVFCFDAAKTDDLDAIPQQPRPGLEGFAAPLRQAIETRLDKQSVLWIAGHLDQAKVVDDALTLAGLALPGMKTKAWSPLLRTKTFVVGLAPQEGLTLVGHFFAGDVKAAQSLQRWFEARRLAEARSYKVEGPPPEAAPADAWVTLQIRGDVETVRGVLPPRP